MLSYSDYRPYLRYFIEHLPRKGRGEINRLALAADVHPSLLSQVLGDTKNIGLEQAHRICEYLGLTPQETEYFLLLVQYQRAGSVKLRGYFKNKLEALRAESTELSERVRQDRKLNEEEKSIFYSHWLYAAIWLRTSLGGGQDLGQISEWFQVSRERTHEILQFLADTQLCVAKDGRYHMGPQSIHLARGSIHLSKHHTNWRLRAIEASDKINQDELMYTAPLSLSQKNFEKIRARMAEVIKEFTDIAIKSDAEQIVCFNMDFFRIRK